jgi:nicotinamide-nucleotide adenylyltransferase
VATSREKRRVLFFGRFQPFHKGHLEAVKWLLERFDEVVILIGMADESHTWLNPFTAGERLLMIHNSLIESGIDGKRFLTATIHTLRIFQGYASFILAYVPPVEAVATANPAVARGFRDAGVNVVTPPLQRRDEWRGEAIRCKMILGDESWRNAVPKPVEEVIDMIDGVQRVRDIVADRVNELVKTCKKREQHL